MLLTILAKSMIRIMPYVEDALELLKDFQQFYQIGELVYVLDCVYSSRCILRSIARYVKCCRKVTVWSR